MRQFIIGCGTALLISGTVWAQANLPAPPAPDAPPPPVQAAPQTVYATTDANIRAGAGKDYNVIGRLSAGQPVQIAGAVPGNPDWLQVASGGFVAQSVTSPTPVPVVHHTHHHSASSDPQPVGDNFPVGSCQPYSRVINIAGQAPQQVNGTACKGPDGAWKIQGNGPVAGVAVPPPPPVVVQGPPVYAAPPPVYAQPVPVYPQPVYPVYR